LGGLPDCGIFPLLDVSYGCTLGLGSPTPALLDLSSRLEFALSDVSLGSSCPLLPVSLALAQ
jgi:hypothetical protein